MILSSIVAVGKNQVIGQNNQMIWNIPSEYDFFLKTVAGHHILLGRKNWESNISNFPLLSLVSACILTNKVGLIQDSIPSNFPFPLLISDSLSEIFNRAEDRGEKEFFIIGGAEIYKATLPFISKLYLSEVPYDGIGDVFFPDYKQFSWNILEQKTHSIDGWKFSLLEKKPIKY